MASTDSNTNTIEWTLRVVESMAFAIHGVLGVTEPWTGCLQGAFNDTHGAMPKWFWPVAGLALWTVAIANFSPNDAVVLEAQAYIASFHMGAFFYHQRIGHQLVVGIRTGSYVVALVGWGVCTVVAFGLSRILVTPPGQEQQPQNTNLLA